MVVATRVAVGPRAEEARRHDRRAPAPPVDQLLQLQRSAGNAAVARALAQQRVQRMRITHAGQDHTTSTMSDRELEDLLDKVSAQDLLKSASHASTAGVDTLIDRLHGSRRSAGSVRALTVLKAQRFMARYGSDVPARLQATGHLKSRIDQLAALEMRVEDYTDDVFANAGVIRQLNAVAAGVAGNALGPAAERVCDMLLFSSLVGRDGQRSMQILTLDDLVAALDPAKLGAAPTAPAPGPAQGAVQPQPPDPRREILQAMMRVNVLGLDAALGGEVTKSQLFTDILNSNVIDVVLLANSQHEEQRYLSTCSIAARDQEVLSRAGTLAGLIVLGRRVVQGVLDDAQARQAALAGQASHQHANLFALANARANKSMTVLDAVEDAALHLVAAGSRDVDAYGALVARWGKAMQRTSAVLELQAGATIPILTKKIVPGVWAFSAFLMIAPVVVRAGGSSDFLEHMEGRMQPPEPASYASATAKSGLPGVAGSGVSVGRRSKQDWSGKIQTLWSKTFARGATPFSVPGHDLVLKAVRSDGEQRFLLGDPKSSSFEKYEPDDLAAYLAKYDIDMPFDPFA